MGRHALRDAVGVRGGLLGGRDVEFSVDLVDPDVRRRPPAADVVADRRFPGVLNVVTRITGNDLRFLFLGAVPLEPLSVGDQGTGPERVAVEPHSVHRQLRLRQGDQAEPCRSGAVHQRRFICRPEKHRSPGDPL